MKEYLNEIFNQRCIKNSDPQKIWLKIVTFSKEKYLKDYNFGVISPDPETSMPLTFSIKKEIQQSVLPIEIAKIMVLLQQDGFKHLGIGVENSFFMKDDNYIVEISYNSINTIIVTFYMKGRGSHYEDYSYAEYN